MRTWRDGWVVTMADLARIEGDLKWMKAIGGIVALPAGPAFARPVDGLEWTGVHRVESAGWADRRGWRRLRLSGVPG